MKKFKLIIILMAFFSFIIAGCANIDSEEQYIVVQKRIGNEYEEYKRVTDKEKVQKVKKILNDIKWKNALAEMVRPPDYRFFFKYSNPDIEAKTVLYELWISPSKDKVELVINDESKYVQLNEKTSAELFVILTGSNLAELNK